MSDVVEDHAPILVVVENGHWECIARTLPPTDREQWLFIVLKELGGVDETSPEGSYYFNVTSLTQVLNEDEKWEVSLIPVD